MSKIYKTHTVKGKVFTLNDIEEEDVPRIVDYWHQSDEKFLMSMGVDLTKLQSPDITAAKFIESVPANRSETSRITLTFKHDDKLVGYTNVNFNQDGIGFGHVHIIDPAYRQVGFVARFFEDAINVYKKEFGVRHLRFQTNKENRRINRYLEKLGYEIAETEYLSKPDGMAKAGWYHTFIVD